MTNKEIKVSWGVFQTRFHFDRVEMHAYNPSTREAKAGGLQVRGQPELHGVFKTKSRTNPGLERTFASLPEDQSTVPNTHIR